ncbi:MAG: hypothetical protein ACLVLH_13405 [Eisenbergiella massiliensis]
MNRVDDFAFTPEQSISHGMTTFTAQNLGAEGTREQKTRRIDDGLHRLNDGILILDLYLPGGFPGAECAHKHS